MSEPDYFPILLEAYEAYCLAIKALKEQVQVEKTSTDPHAWLIEANIRMREMELMHLVVKELRKCVREQRIKARNVI